MTAPSRYSGPLPSTIWDVLKYAWKRGIYLQSDFARGFSPEIALAASMGWLSNIDPDGKHYRGQWRITSAGLIALEHKDDFGCTS